MKKKLYPLADTPPGGLRLGSGPLMARPTGEKRPPRKGEWYLSGAQVEAYRAHNDLSTPYHIAELATPP